MARAGWPSGRVSPNKALEHTIAALAVARAHGDPEATLHLVGKPATDSYVAALQRYVVELGLADAVQFAGHASDATVASAYAEADVLVVTSEHEGFCVPVVEAMAAGMPVVAFDQGAVPEVLGGAGVLVSDKDPYTLAGAIAALWRDTPGAGHLGRGGQPAPRRARSRDGRRTASSTCSSRWWARAPARRRVMTAVHQFVPMLHRADAVGRHTLRLREVLVARGVRSRDLRRDDRRGDGCADAAVRPLRRGGRTRGRAGLPVRHRVGHGSVARSAP